VLIVLHGWLQLLLGADHRHPQEMHMGLLLLQRLWPVLA
jgi:hypothetical protein